MHHLQYNTTTNHTVLQAELTGTIQYETFYSCSIPRELFSSYQTQQSGYTLYY